MLLEAGAISRSGVTPYLVVAVELEILFWLKGIWFRLFRYWFDPLGHVGKDLSHAEHTVRIQPVVAIRPTNCR